MRMRMRRTQTKKDTSLTRRRWQLKESRQVEDARTLTSLTWDTGSVDKLLQAGNGTAVVWIAIPSNFGYLSVKSKPSLDCAPRRFVSCWKHLIICVAPSTLHRSVLACKVCSFSPSALMRKWIFLLFWLYFWLYEQASEDLQFNFLLLIY